MRLQDASWLPKSNKASLLPAIIAPLNSLKDYPKMGGGWRPTWEFWQQHNLLQDNRETPTVENSQVGEAGRPGGQVLVLSLLLRDCVTSGRFPPLSGPHFSSLCNERGGLKSGFKLCLMKPWSPKEGFLGAALGEGAVEGRQDR